PELTKPLGEAVAGLYRFTVKVNGVVHSLDWQNLYKPFLELGTGSYINLGGGQYIDQKTKELKVRGPQINGPLFLGTTQLNDGSYYVPWIKKFVYFPKDNGFFDFPMEASKFYEVSQENHAFPKIPNNSECKFTGNRD